MSFIGSFVKDYGGWSEVGRSREAADVAHSCETLDREGSICVHCVVEDNEEAASLEHHYHYFACSSPGISKLAI